MAYTGFDRLQGELAGRYGTDRAGAIAAAIGRRKYGKGAFQHAAATGHSLKGSTPVKPKPKPKLHRRRHRPMNAASYRALVASAAAKKGSAAK